MHEIAKKLYAAELRIERMLWLPGVCNDHPPVALIDFADEVEHAIRFAPRSSILEPLAELNILPALSRLVDDEGLSGRDLAVELAMRLGNRNGFLFEAATPYTYQHKGRSYTYSWGRYRTAWMYAETSEDIAARCVAWAKKQIGLDRLAEAAVRRSA